MATVAQQDQIATLVTRLFGLYHGTCRREQRDPIDNMIAHLLHAKTADSDIAAQEIEHAQRIVGR